MDNPQWWSMWVIHVPMNNQVSWSQRKSLRRWRVREECLVKFSVGFVNLAKLNLGGGGIMVLLYCQWCWCIAKWIELSPTCSALHWIKAWLVETWTQLGVWADLCWESESLLWKETSNRGFELHLSKNVWKTMAIIRAVVNSQILDVQPVSMWPHSSH